MQPCGTSTTSLLASARNTWGKTPTTAERKAQKLVASTMSSPHFCSRASCPRLPFFQFVLLACIMQHWCAHLGHFVPAWMPAGSYACICCMGMLMETLLAQGPEPPARQRGLQELLTAMAAQAAVPRPDEDSAAGAQDSSAAAPSQPTPIALEALEQGAVLCPSHLYSAPMLD